MNRINQYLLTHYPLLWNTRVVWVLGANLLLHLFFFTGGLVSVSAYTLRHHSSIWEVGGAGVYMMAVLCSAVMVIVWCIFYLRNNAFKSFYRIGRWYLVKEFAIIFIILLTSISYSVSYQHGVRLRIRGITNEQEMVAEINAINRAMVYIPTSRENYFILNDCESRRLRQLQEEQERERQTRIAVDSVVSMEVVDETSDTLINDIRLDTAQARRVLARPDVYSFLNYCTNFVNAYHYTVDSAEAVSTTNRQWLRSGQRDAMRTSITKLFGILSKYGITHRLNADSITNAVFRDSFFTVPANITGSQYDYQVSYPHELEGRYEFLSYQLSNVIDLVEDAQPRASDYTEAWLVIGYTALSLSVLLICYRRFSKRVFLISIVGSLLWAILVSLVAVGGGGDVGIPALLLFLCLLFLGIGLLQIWQRGNKTAAGVALCWHAYMAPFAVMLVVWLIKEYLDSRQSIYYNYPDDFFRSNFPFSFWVDRHETEIFLVNIPVMAIYIALLFNAWTKRWQAMPEE